MRKMGGSPQVSSDKGLIGYLIVVSRIPVGVTASIFVTLFFVGWFSLETVAAFLIFPFAAVFANQIWIRSSWLGMYPASLRKCSDERFKYYRAIWNWVTDPMEKVDLDTELTQRP